MVSKKFLLLASSVSAALVLASIEGTARADPHPDLVVPATADIFAAGLAAVPDFSGGGGTLPQRAPVAAGTSITIEAGGTVDCGAGAPAGPDGSTGGGTVAIQSSGVSQAPTFLAALPAASRWLGSSPGRTLLPVRPRPASTSLRPVQPALPR